MNYGRYMKNEVIKLNLGIGNRKIGEGFTGVDINKGKYTDVVCDITKLEDKFSKESIDEIYSRHVIEHFPQKEIPTILKSWVSLLKPNGKITLNFPDLDRYVDFYVKHRDQIPVEEFARWIYGNQKDGYDLHKAGFNGKYIADILIKLGITIKSISPAVVGNGLPSVNKSIIGTEIIGIK
jgi:predicted SAM-dependent methyltransferase